MNAIVAFLGAHIHNGRAHAEKTARYGVIYIGYSGGFDVQLGFARAAHLTAIVHHYLPE